MKFTSTPSIKTNSSNLGIPCEMFVKTQVWLSNDCS